MPRLLQTLKFQIVLAIALLTLLFASSTLYSLHVIDQQHSDDVLLRLAGRLQFHQQHMTMQAMRYESNAPRDYPSYYRDLRLYFEDLKVTRDELSALIDAFASNRFMAVARDESMAMQPRLPSSTLAAARRLADDWQAFLAGLDERLGPDPAEPRLEWAAEWIVEQNRTLEAAAETLHATLRDDVAQRAERAGVVNRVLLGAALIVSIVTGIWFYRHVLAPLSTAVRGFQKVADGDFSHRVAATYNNEIGWLVESFNHLSNRLDALRRLLTGLEQGADLEGTLRTLSATLPSLIPVDWIGVLVIGADGQIHLEKAFSDGNPHQIGRLSFDPDRTLLEECVSNREPLHIPDVQGMAQMSESYVFLRRLGEFGRRDAVFLPVGTGTIQGVAVFASRFPNNFRTEHLALLRNLGVLLGVSLGRTIQLAESSRLASIGQFASGIVHEIRNPLATIGLALDHLSKSGNLVESSAKRVTIAAAEVARLERLLADILLYAKPLRLEFQQTDLVETVTEAIAAETGTDDIFEISSNPCPLVAADRDRIRQVLLNLIRNAQQASPQGAAIRVHCQPEGDHWVRVEIRNLGEPIPARVLERIFEPFVTTKSGGTGLGLPIVRRIVEAHGGTVHVDSDALAGTCVSVKLPTHAHNEPA